MRRVASWAGLNACVCLFIVSLCLGLIPLFGQTDMPPVLVGISITPGNGQCHQFIGDRYDLTDLNQ